MAEKVTLLDLSFNTSEAVDGLDALIAKSLDLAEKKKDLTKKINDEKMALAGIRQNYRDQLLDQTSYEKAVAKSTATIVGLTKDQNNNSREIAENNSAIKANTTIVNAQEESVNSLRARLALNTAELNKMSIAQRTTSAEGKLLVEQTKAMSDQLKNLEKGVGDTRRNVGNYAGDIEKTAGEMGGLTGATGMMVKGMAGGIASVKAFNAALMANPFVAIATAVLFLISTIGKLMDRNNELATSVSSILAPIQWAITKVLDVVAKLFAEIARVFEWLVDKYLQVYNWLGIISDETLKNIETARGMAQVERDIYNAETDNVLVLARQRRELEAQRTIAADQNKTAEERKAALNEALRISQEMEKAELAVLQSKYDQIAAENKLSYTTDEDRRKEVEALAAIEQRQAEYESQRRELVGQRSGFEKAENDKIEANRKAAADRYAAAQKKAVEEAKAVEIAAAKEVEEAKKKEQQETLAQYENAVTELQLRIRESNIGIVDKEKVIRDQDEINAAILEKERYRLEQGLITKQEYDNRSYQMDIEQAERRAALQAEQDQIVRDREAMDLENRRALDDARITNEFELKAIQLERQYQMEIANAEKIGADVSLIEKKYADISEKNERAKQNAKMAIAAGVAGQMSNLLGEESAAGKQFAIIQATINTYLGASKALAQGGILGIAQAAIVIAAGFKQVMSIMKVKDDVPKVSTSTKKYAKGGQITGPSHAQGGVTFKGSNGQVFEAEGGENMYILNKKASSAINALSRVNQHYGGASFNTSNVYKYANGGGFEVISNNSYTNVTRNNMMKSQVDLSQKTINAIAEAFVEGIENAPNPIVSVQDIIDTQDNRNVIISQSVD